MPPSTSYAQEGTAAHALAELALRRAVSPHTYIGTTLEGVEVTEDMADFVQVYVDFCRERIEAGAAYWIEHRFNLAALNPPGPMFGTADFVANTHETLDVVDLKYGMGVAVEVDGNKQLRYYALGACLSLGLRPEYVRITVVQPRKEHGDGVIRSETLAYDELIAYAAELMEAARATQQPDAPLNPGAHCRFCPASGVCPAQLARAQAVARTEFATVEAMPPAPSTIPEELFVDMLGKLHILEDWMKAMRAHAMGRLERGEHVPGYKLVATRPTRYWIDATETTEWLKAKGYAPDEYEERKLKSPAQIEKLVGKKSMPTDLVEKRSSGRTMVPEGDKRPALTITAGEEFPLLTAGDE